MDTLRLIHCVALDWTTTRTYLRHKELSIDATEAAFYGGARNDAKT